MKDVFVTKLDPTGSALVYSTFLGGTSSDDSRSIAVDAAGDAFITGETLSADFPTTAGAFDTTFNGTSDVFVTKLDPNGSALGYSTFLGGARSDRGAAITLDALPTPNAFIAGQTFSTDFPTTPGAFQTTSAGQIDIFVTKLDSTGSALVYSTYLGGTRDDSGRGIAVDAAGDAYVTGETLSTAFPTTPDALAFTLSGRKDAFVTKLNSTGSALVYSTYLGGGGDERGTDIAVDAAGSAYVTGQTLSTDFPTTAGAFDMTFNSVADAFVVKISDFGPPATLVLVPNAATNPAGSQHCVSATVRDAAGRPVVGVTVRFSVTGLQNTAGALRTDANGQAQFCYAATKTGNDRIAAFADTNSNGVQNPSEPGGTATKTWVAGPPATLALTPKDATVPVNTQRCVTATVRDSLANPVTGVAVLFAVTGSVTATGSAPTDANGQAQFCYLGPSQASTDSITGFADANNSGVQDTGEPGDIARTTWAVPGAPTTLMLTPKDATTPVNSQHCMTATVRDAFGNPVTGIGILFAVTGSVATTGAAATDANGQAPFCYLGPSQPGMDTITAFADPNNNGARDPSEPGDSATKTWLGPPAALTLMPKTATSPVTTQHCVTATVADAVGTPVAGVTVQFAVSGSVTTTGTAATDATGQTPFCYLGPPQAGTDTISAFADANSNTVQDAGEPGDTATTTWAVPGAPSALTLAPDTATNSVGTQHCVTATVRDTFGSAVAGVTVQFSVTGSVTATGSATASPGGQATFCYLGPSVQGSDTIAAFADTNNNGFQDADEPGNTATKNWTAADGVRERKNEAA